MLNVASAMKVKIRYRTSTGAVPVDFPSIFSPRIHERKASEYLWTRNMVAMGSPFRILNVNDMRCTGKT